MRDWTKWLREQLQLPEMTGHRDKRIISELADHLEEIYREALAEGGSEDEADAVVRTRLGDLDRAARELRRSERHHIAAELNRRLEAAEERARRRGRLWARLSDLGMELRLAARRLIKRPGFTGVAVLSLGLGIGANTAIFSLVHSVLIRPLPYPNSEQLVGVFRIDPRVTGPNPTASSLSSLYAVPYEVFVNWADMSRAFASAGAYAGTGYTLLGDEGPRQLEGAVMTSGVFAALAISPQLGRHFLPEDDEVGADPAVVLSYGFWQSRYGEDPNVLGQPLELDGAVYTIVGVMPAGFRFPMQDTDVWTTFSDELKTLPVRNSGYLQVIARLKPGISLEQAQLDVDGVAQRIAEAHPAESEHGIGLFPSKALIVGDSGGGLLMLMGAVGLVLLIACANIANLFLVRANERRRELAVSQALGAGRGRLIWQHMLESVLLSLLGGAAGFAIAVIGLEPFMALLPRELPRMAEISVDYRLLLFAAGFAGLTGILSGILPALSASRTPINEVLQEAGRGLVSRRSNRTQAALLVAEIALAFVLLTGAGLFTRSLTRLLAVDPGFASGNLAVVGHATPLDRRDTWESVIAYFEDLDRRLLALPGVEAVGRANQMPFAGGWSAPPVSIETAEGIWDGSCHFAMVSPGYLPTMRIPVVAGRGISDDDRQDSEPIVLVSRILADRMGGNALGRRIRVNTQGDSIWRVVVGVVGDVSYRLADGSMPMFYVPYSQRPTGYQNVVIRASIDPLGLAPAIRSTIWEQDPRAPASVNTMEDFINSSYVLGGSRFLVVVLSSLSVLAALITLIGVYGVLAYSVNQRVKDIGIRMALGAEHGEVVRAVLGRGLIMAGIGLAIGGAIAFAFGRTVRGLLFGVQPMDPLILVAVALLVIVAVAAASYLPARRAASLNPVDVLRSE
jgi:predicted permease